MKNLTINLAMLIVSIIVIASCGRQATTDNDFLGTLPSLAANYDAQLEDLKQKAKEATSMDDAFKYDKEYDLLKEEAEKVLEETFATSSFSKSIDFSELETERFTVHNIMITGVDRTRLNFKAMAIAKEDLKNKYGGWEKFVFGYIVALDAQGNKIGKPTVMASSMATSPEYHAGDTIWLNASAGPLKDYIDFKAFQFMDKEEYDSIN